MRRCPESVEGLDRFVCLIVVGIHRDLDVCVRLLPEVDNIATAKAIRTAIEITARNAKSAFAD